MANHIEGAANIVLKSGVFLNPAQVFNRDLSILVASVFAKGKESIKILEPLAASGIRSVRYYKELTTPISKLLANDISPQAVEEIKANFQNNGVEAEVTQQDACHLMHNSKIDPWDLIDIDPYGSCANFLDASIQAIKDQGLLCVTSTDMATLCGNNPDTCFYKYSSVPTKSKFCHEFAIRIILNQLKATANKYQKVVVPVLSLSVDFYIRVFVQVIESASQAKNSILNSSLVFQCGSCPNFFIHDFGKPGKKRNTPGLFSGQGFCSHCGGNLFIQGPIYSGKLHNKELVNECLQTIDQFQFKTHNKLKGILLAVKDELDCPLSWDLSQLCKFFRAPTISQKQWRSAFKSLGLSLSQSHTKPQNYKTNATPHQVFEIIKSWKMHSAKDKYLTNVAEGSSASKILSSGPSLEPNFELELTQEEKELLNSVRYPPNPQNWGPKSRPKRERPEPTQLSVQKKQKS